MSADETEIILTKILTELRAEIEEAEAAGEDTLKLKDQKKLALKLLEPFIETAKRKQKNVRRKR